MDQRAGKRLHKALSLARSYARPHASSDTPAASLPRRVLGLNRASPPSSDEPCVLSRADILQDKRLITGGQVYVRQVGFAHIQPVGGVLTSGQLKDVGY